jgi:D-amino-acid dehydrogenase
MAMRIIVMGAGVIGVTTAWELASDGHQVTLLDRQDEPAQETSFSNAGMVSPGHAYTWGSPRAPGILFRSLFRDDVALRLRLRADPAMWAWCWRFLKECTAERARINTTHKVRLCRYSLDRFDELASRLPIDYDCTRRGALYVYREADHYQRGVAATAVLTENGVPLQPVSTEEAFALEPALAPDRDRIAGAIHCPIDQSGDCRRFTLALAAAATNYHGVEFRGRTDITRLVIDGDRITGVETSQGSLSADAYVLALGSYSAQIARTAGVRLPVYPVKGYALTVPIGDHAGAPVMPGVDEQYLIAWSRLGSRLRVTAKADFAGFDRSHNDRDFSHMLETIRRLFPDGGDYEAATRWAGLRPMTPRGTPILGACPIKGLFLNTGHGHIGWTMSMGSARALADLIAGRRPEISLDGLTLAEA